MYKPPFIRLILIIVFVFPMIFWMISSLSGHPPVQNISWGSSLAEGINQYPDSIVYDIKDGSQGAVSGIIQTGLLQLINTINAALPERSREYPFLPQLQGMEINSILEIRVGTRRILLIYNEDQKLFQAAVLALAPLDSNSDPLDPNRLNNINMQRWVNAFPGNYNAPIPIQTDRYGNTFIYQWNAQDCVLYGLYVPEYDMIEFWFIAQ